MKDPWMHHRLPLGRKGVRPELRKGPVPEGTGLAERKAWTLLTTNSHWGSFDMVMRTRRRLDF